MRMIRLADMIREFIRKLTAWMLTGSMLLAGNSGMVLCIGEDGHFEVETAYHDHGTCTHDADACGHQDAEQPADNADVHRDGECEDIPLDITSLLIKTLQPQRLLAIGPPPPLPFGYDAALVRSAAYWQQHPPGEAIPRLAASLLEKQSIVLRV